MPASKPSLRDEIHAHLLVHGPSTAQEIHQALLADGLITTRTAGSVSSSLRGSRFAFQLPDERWDLTTRALAGVVLTVRPRSRLRDNVLWVHGDLEPFDGLLTGEGIPLLSGGLALRGGGQIRTLIGPDGWLPAPQEDGLIALRWNGNALDVFAVDQPVAADRESLAPVRDLLCRHREGLMSPYGSAPPLTTVVLSALREAPDLFAVPRPPLSEVLPLPPREISDSSIWEAHRDGRRLTLHLPERVYEELRRRADLLCEDLADHAAVLLGAATDRVQPGVQRGCDSYDYRYDDIESRTREIVMPLRSVSR